ncbi:MAG: hypothetical protein EBS01_09185, partial [Verrucomicrobia bacterium]|nr:hypothetical protein [Verrucomicrobiota bacterium]
GSLTFLRTVAQGGGDLVFGWERERGDRWSALPGVNTSELALSGLRQSDAGRYRAFVSNARGSATSASATLTVREVDVVTKPPLASTVNPGDMASFTVGASGVDLTYQWRKDGVAIPLATQPSAASAKLVLANVSSADAGLYDVVVTHAYGTSVSASAPLAVNTPPSILVSPLGGAVKAGSRLTLFVKASGTGPLSYHWRKNGVLIAGAADSDSLTFSSVSGSDAGSYDVVVENVAGTQTSVSADVFVPVGVAIRQQPVSQSVIAGSPATFFVGASGTPKAGSTGLSYRWRKDGVELVDDGNVSGSGTDTLSIAMSEGATNSARGSSGNYDVVVSNDVNAVVSVPASLTVNSAPLVTQQPGSRSAKDGEEVRFAVGVSGAAPLSYQWFHIVGNASVAVNSANFTGFNSPELVIRRANGSDTAGAYYVVVRNPYGQVKSATAMLSQLRELSIVEDESPSPAAQSGMSLASLPASVSLRTVETRAGLPLSLNFTTAIPPQDGVDIAFQWRRNGVALSDGAGVSGATSRALSIASLANTDGGVYDLQISALSGGAEKSRAFVRTTLVTILQPPTISGLKDLLARPGQSASFEPAVQSSVAGGTLAYQWYFNGTLLPAQTAAKLAFPAVKDSDSGVYTLAVTDSVGTSRASVTLSVAAPLVVSSLPATQDLEARARLALEVNATSASGSLRYQWRFNGNPIRGAVGPRLSVYPVSSTHAGAYDVVVSNGYERLTSNACRVSVGLPWRILTQPASTNLNAGEPLQLTVQLNRSGPVSYQWYRGKGRAVSPLSAQTSPTLSVPAVGESDEGTYFVLITTPTERLTSDLARVSVNRPVVVTQHPSSASVRPGASVTFVAKATGTGVLSYQWTRNGAPIAGANGPELSLSVVSPADAGTYRVTVKNLVSIFGVTSEPAVLQVTSPAVLSGQPADTKALQGGSVMFSVVASGEGELSYQWRRNGLPITGAISPTLARSGVSVADTGYYDCVVHTKIGTQDIGDSISRSAFLQVVEPVTVLAVPADRRAAVTGDNNRSATFRVIAAGTPP